MFLESTVNFPLDSFQENIDLQSKSIDWFLYGNGLHLQRVKGKHSSNYLFNLNICFSFSPLAIIKSKRTHYFTSICNNTEKSF